MGKGAAVDAQGWDSRYAGQELVWSAGPNATVAEQTAGLAPGRALDLGAGEGRNAVWLAEQGWAVTAVDFSEVGLAKGRRLAERRSVRVDWVAADVTTYRPGAVDGSGPVFDLVLLAYLQLPIAVLGPVLATAAAALAPGGTLLVVGHDRANLTGGVGGPQDPAVLHTADELTAALPGLRIEHAGPLRRPVEVDGGTRYAIDTLVRAVRPAG